LWSLLIPLGQTQLAPDVGLYVFIVEELADMAGFPLLLWVGRLRRREQKRALILRQRVEETVGVHAEQVERRGTDADEQDALTQEREEEHGEQWASNGDNGGTNV